LGLKPEDEVLINVGRREYQKGQRFLLEAMARLCSDRPRVVLLVAGRDGQASKELDEQRVRLGLHDRVRFLGHREDLPDLLCASDLFVFPSLFEGLGGALIEAMALELPVVAADIDAVREVADSGRSASLVPPGSSLSLAEAIRDLLNDRSKARAFGTRGREVYLSRFTLDRCVERMTDLYCRVAAAAAVSRGSSSDEWVVGG
jgi:glycosyltransferase involved in cell wall biosynthesis